MEAGLLDYFLIVQLSCQGHCLDSECKIKMLITGLKSECDCLIRAAVRILFAQLDLSLQV